MIEIRWHGRGGQGSFTAAKLLGSAVSLYGGKQALAFPSFGPERRGAPVLAFTKIDDKKITDRSEVRQCDYIVVLDETLFQETFLQDLKQGGRIIVNSGCPENYRKYGRDKVAAVDATAVALAILGQPITNTAMVGALIAVAGLVDFEAVLNGMNGFFKGAVLQKNIEVATKVFQQCKGAGV